VAASHARIRTPSPHRPNRRATPGEANRPARTLVEERLAACATLLPAGQ